MAVKAIAMIASFDCETNGDLNLYLDINNKGNVSHAVHYGPVDPTTTDLTMDADLKNFVKQYTIDTWSESYGMLDTVRILFKLNSLV